MSSQPSILQLCLGESVPPEGYAIKIIAIVIILCTRPDMLNQLLEVLAKGQACWLGLDNLECLVMSG